MELFLTRNPGHVQHRRIALKPPPPSADSHRESGSIWQGIARMMQFPPPDHSTFPLDVIRGLPLVHYRHASAISSNSAALGLALGNDVPPATGQSCPRFARAAGGFRTAACRFSNTRESTPPRPGRLPHAKTFTRCRPRSAIGDAGPMAAY